MRAILQIPLRGSRRGYRCAQAGVSLVEVLVAMVIALFMLAALMTVFLNLRGTVRDQERLAALQDSERLVMTMLANTVQSAGYFPDPLNQVAADALPALADNAFGDFVAGQAIVGQSGADGASDTLTARFVTASGDGIMNCQGAANTSGASVAYLNTFAVNAANELTCAVNGGAPVPLAGGISALRVRYGTDTGNGGNVDTYLSASAVSAGALWGQVRSARVTLTFANPFAGQPGQPATLGWTQTISLMNRP
ncbi:MULTISPECIES: PilW family protein [Cupriavidus]|uniref:PilW family protein n=1 Tax=Cupriavidus TaxID=106589 RepID=UPI000E15A0F5|nr:MULTISPECIES: PilW family protein [Cupriavidus]MEC3764828.1 PilW family protein [Cupriavidus sp. SS-3]SOY82264.1 putative type 4 fimbrial biogenesis transmembrane pilW-related protein precursor [Cupriavidus taiwanensis]SOY82625.1 putative type 4 fimbrial biogenesis transmembrane pilW-related protein precursor [Cupriavidus taiwanensis]